MRWIPFLFLFCTSHLNAQSKVFKKLEKVVGLNLEDIQFNTGAKVDSNMIKTVWSVSEDSIKIGQTYKGEYIQFKSPVNADTVTELKTVYITESAISKEEFLKFRQWVIDSTARKLAYFGQEDGWHDDNWLMIPKKIKKHGYSMNLPFDINNKEEVANVFPLNWNRKFYYTDPELVPIFDQLYPTKNERFRNMKPFDYRKVFYHFGKPHSRNLNKVPIFMDSYDWMLPSEHNFSCRAVMSYLNDKILLEQAVIHIEPFMAEAYCHWKTKVLSGNANFKNWKVSCRLPTASELKALNSKPEKVLRIDSFNPTENWKITNSEFKIFCSATLDSLCKEFLYFNEPEHEQALTLLNYTNYFYSEGDLEYVEVDPSRRQECRNQFTFSDAKIRWRDFGYLDRDDFLQKNSINANAFRYQWIDAKAKSQESAENLYLHGQMYGQTGFGAKDHNNLGVFIKNTVTVLPFPDSLTENDEIADITYEQALAYYNWKFRIDKFQKGDDWQQYVFPTEEEFNRIKKGETIIHPAQEIEYDSPVFRMVVELIPKN